jgi:hypothetical protein
MREQLIAYFIGEKRGALILVLAGIVALATAIALLATRSSYRGMAVPLGLVALFELGIGVVLLARAAAMWAMRGSSRSRRGGRHRIRHSTSPGKASIPCSAAF